MQRLQLSYEKKVEFYYYSIHSIFGQYKNTTSVTTITDGDETIRSTIAFLFKVSGDGYHTSRNGCCFYQESVEQLLEP